ncbi:MAG TPA: S53 family peptidase [Terriglobales bacterium]|nr:S53 family peptidase [Terriglobales bacterium]
MASNKRISLNGSERRPVTGFRSTGAADPNELIEITVTLRPHSPIDSQEIIQNSLSQPKGKRQTREQAEQKFSASPASMQRVQSFARENNLKVESADPLKRTVILSGTVSAFASAFNVSLERFERGNESYRGRTGPVQIPQELANDVESVLGLDNRPQARPHFRRRQRKTGPHVAGQSFTPNQIADLYDFPPGLNGSGQCIAMIELGGGYRDQDLQTYFSKLNIPLPTVTAMGVDGANNSPTGDPNGPDGEVLLDIEVAGAVAPGAQIVVYFAPNTDRGFLDAIKAAVHDKTYKPSVISISWGSAEDQWTSQAMTAFDSAFQVAASMGVSVCVACGDNGSSDGEPSGDHVDFPASSPFALACGGTKLVTSGTQIQAETVWNDGPGQGATGGGYSQQFPVPAWQKSVNMKKGRGVPDVAGDADPQTGYDIIVDGTEDVFGGTSAVAPLWAGLIARLNQGLGTPVGYLNPLLYSEPAIAFHDITQGNNGSFKAGKGWDPCTGLGSPDGQQLLKGLRQKSAQAA